MTIDLPQRRPIISGIGISPIGRKTAVEGRELTKDAAQKAIADAGLEPTDIGGVMSMGETPIEELAADLGLVVDDTGGTIDVGGLFSPMMSAVHAVTQGRARHVLVYRTVKMVGGTVTQSEKAKPTTLQSPIPDWRADRDQREMATLMTFHAYSAASWVAMYCRRHMHLYGTTKRQLGALAIHSRSNAAKNPLAVYQDPLTMDDYLAARPISDPLGLLDCDVPVDGSIAFIVSDPSHAPDCPSLPISIEAMGGATGAGGWDQRPDYPHMAATDAAADLWSRTDFTTADIDVAELYDGFTFLTMVWLEALGLCAEGEAGPFVEDGSRIALDGELPLNTYGGQLSAGRLHGYWTLHEACVQLRGQGGDRQVANAEVAIASAGGGPIAGCFLLRR